jgi:hypothetical protein
MVIITTIIAKVYFPDSLKRGSIPNIRKKYSYRRQPTDESEEQQSYADDEEDELEALYSEDEDEEKEEEERRANADLSSSLEYEQEDALLADMTGSPGVNNNGPSFHGAARALEFDQVQTSQAKVFQRLLFCCLMLNVTFVTWGALQERMLTRRYPRHTGDYFTYS